MGMGIPIVEFLISQKSTQGTAYEGLRILIPSFADSPRGYREEACLHNTCRSHSFKMLRVLHNYIEEELV